MKVTVFGIGYVGLVQAAVLASVGHDVMCVDIDANKIENLKKGIIPSGLEFMEKDAAKWFSIVGLVIVAIAITIYFTIK